MAPNPPGRETDRQWETDETDRERGQRDGGETRKAIQRERWGKER